MILFCRKVSELIIFNIKEQYLLLTFVLGYAYYLKLTVYNRAGVSTEDWSNPILLDLELASSGEVRHGADWHQPLTGFQSDASSLQGSIAYLYTSLIDAFRLQSNHNTFLEPIWNNFTANRLDACKCDSCTVRVAYCEPPGDQKSVHDRDTSY